MKDSLCVDSCGTGYWADENSGEPECSPCIEHCDVCADNDTCTTCDTGDGWFKSSTSGVCVNSCTDNGGAQYGDTETGDCTNCE